MSSLGILVSFLVLAEYLLSFVAESCFVFHIFGLFIGVLSMFSSYYVLIKL